MNVLFKGDPFILGKCQCGCGEEIPIRSTEGVLQRFKHGHQSVGDNHYNWKGGKKISHYGYVEILKHDHPNATSRGYVLEHRYVMEQYLGRYLRDDEDVHHKNKNRTDNRIENLQIMTRGTHMSHHNTVDMSDRKCFICGSNKTQLRKNGRQNWYKKNNDFICRSCYLKIKRKENKK